MIAQGNEFLIYNAETQALPFETCSVPKVITNSVRMGTAPGGLFRPVLPSEIIRVLKVGGQWVNNGQVVYTKQ